MDLNADLGEECGDDAAMLRLVSSASLACGGHAGGGEVLRNVTAMAAANGVSVGAHPSYSDRAGFGRTSQLGTTNPDALLQDLVSQIAEVGRAAANESHPLSYVKPHGALYHDVALQESAATILLNAIEQVEALARVEGWPSRRGETRLSVLGLPGSLLERAAASRGIPFLREAFADRAYLPSGHLVSRSEPGAVLGHAAAVSQALQLATEKSVTCVDGSILPLQVDSICLHGDTPGAVEMARAVRHALESAGISIRSPEAN